MPMTALFGTAESWNPFKGLSMRPARKWNSKKQFLCLKKKKILTGSSGHETKDM